MDATSSRAARCTAAAPVPVPLLVPLASLCCWLAGAASAWERAAGALLTNAPLLLCCGVQPAWLPCMYLLSHVRHVSLQHVGLQPDEHNDYECIIRLVHVSTMR